MIQRMRALRAQIAALKQELANLEELRPGSLSRQYNICGSPGCRCKGTPPQKHGPYYHLSYTRKGKGGTRLSSSSRPCTSHPAAVRSASIPRRAFCSGVSGMIHHLEGAHVGRC
jgi:hypothetical protein